MNHSHHIPLRDKAPWILAFLSPLLILLAGCGEPEPIYPTDSPEFLNCIEYNLSLKYAYEFTYEDAVDSCNHGVEQLGPEEFKELFQ